MGEPVIRAISRTDNEAIARIIRKSLEEFHANKPGTVYFDTATDHLSEAFKASRSAYFILEEDGTIAGGAGIYPTAGLPQDTCELVKMYLAPSFRKKGFGKMLLQRCIQQAKAYGYTKLYIETMPELKNAIHLYEKFNFTFLKGPLGNSGHDGCDIWLIREIQ